MRERTYEDLDVQSNLGGQFSWTSRRAVAGDQVCQAYVDEGPRDAHLTFVLLHGNPTWGFLYRKFIPALSPRYRVIVPDHVGFGRSDKPQDGAYYTLERHIQNLTNLLDEAKANNVVLAVQDWGGPIGMGWATRHAERVAGLVVMNTWAFVRDPPMRLPWWFKALVRGKSGWSRNVRCNFFTEFILGKGGTVRKLTRDELDGYRAAHPRPVDRTGVARFPRLIPETSDTAHETWETMKEIEDALTVLRQKPALLCWALKDPAFRKPHLERWARAFDRVDGPHTFRNAGHYLQEDVSSEILAHIERWLSETKLG